MWVEQISLFKDYRKIELPGIIRKGGQESKRNFIFNTVSIR